jgi:iron complex transport system substrate-binding protein
MPTIQTRLFILGLLLLWEMSTPSQAGQPAPERVISTIPSLTEILYALHLEDRIIGVSKFCRYPAEAQKKEIVGGFMDPNLEKIITLRPDWIAVFGNNTRVIDAVEPLGTRVYSKHIETSSETFETILEMGQVFHVEASAENLVKSIQQEFRAIGEALADLPARRVLYVVGRTPGTLQQLYAVGKGSFMDEMLVRARGINCVEANLGAFPVLSREALLISNPEVIIDAGAAPEQALQGVIPPEWDVLASVQAVREKRIIPLDDPRLTIVGSAMPDILRKIAILIHGDAARSRLGKD